jgi:diadenosine tetraphosphate (Ap4A) HIT family hydrolase
MTSGAAAMAECLLCNSVEDPQSAGDLLLAESEVSVAVLHEDWAVRGHALVVARRHVENLSDLSEDEARRFSADLARVEKALLSVTGAERAILMKLGIQVPHLHVHIYPVRATADRASVMAAIDGKARDELRGPKRTEFIEALRRVIQQE